MANPLGYAADRNEVANPAALNPCTITSNVDWVPTAPLDAMKTTPLIDAAVSTRLGDDPDDPDGDGPVVIEFEWDSPIDLTYVGLIDTNLEQLATVRLEAWTDALGTDLAATAQTNVVPPLVDPATLRFGAPNQFRGDMDPRDYPLFPKNVHLVVSLCRVRRVRLSIWGDTVQTDGQPDTGYRIGLAWVGDGLPFDRHVGSSGEDYRSYDQRTETDGGGVWVEPGIGRRAALIDRAVTDRTLRDALFRMAMRVGKSKPIVWLPNVTDPAACFQYGGLFRRVDDHAHKYMAPFYTSGSIELEEWRE
ncbi:hypothetical protein [Azospirillum picis]|uniref:Uncharacterized protein n=1 Tax=Azospirillum picis TaxID=488438 RepID=A0ABU0MEC1_9PROT|nr:hypothetical protein [Azospirillum picis]MBP2297947.1 hypothetical protein [Azospirillum picis]MDQ0531785.1 hypothetical protein [Azospirillum picis]